MSGRFAVGDAVIVKAEYPKTGHIRTPYYVRGLSGVVADALGPFPNPESRGVGGDGLPEQTLYRIRFKQTDTWPDYGEDPRDTVDIEIYEHWLEPANGT